MRFLLPLSLTCCLLWIHTAVAKELKDEEYGFRCEIPDRFKEFDGPNKSRIAIHAFAYEAPAPDPAPFLIQFKIPLRGTGLDQRLTISDVPAVKGATVTLEDYQWRGRTIDLIHTISNAPDGVQYVNYVLQIPLTKKAVQLQVGGRLDQDAEVRKILDETAAGFEDLQPLPPQMKDRRTEPGSGPASVKRLQYTLYDQMRMFFRNVPPLVFVGAGVLVVIAVAGVVMLRRR